MTDKEKPTVEKQTRAVDKDTLDELRRAARRKQGASDKQGANPAVQQPPPDITPVETRTVGAANDRPTSEVTSTANERSSSTGRLAAREFAKRESTNDSEEPTSQLVRKKSSATVIVAVLVAGWIVAGGAFFALRSLQTDDADDNTTDELVIDSDLEPTPVPTSPPPATPTPELDSEPTPVPPTPEWRPVNDGPRSAPFTFTVEAIVNDPRFYDSQDGAPTTPQANGMPLPLSNPTGSGAPLVLRVVSGEPSDSWAQVALPITGDVVWVQSEDFLWSSTERLIQINIATNSLTVFEGNSAEFETTVATGERSRVTPQTSTFVLENASRFGLDGTELFRLAATGPNSGPDLDGLPTLAIGITDDFTLIGNYATDGDILVDRSVASELAALISPGAKVEIFGSPPPPATPTPTPAPTPDIVTGPGPSGNVGGGCPTDAFGSPPDCYRLVDRPTITGECGTSQLELNGSCVVFGGDPEIQGDFTARCPEGAPEEINGRCYVTIGPIPELPGDCPSGSNDVDGECRVPA